MKKFSYPSGFRYFLLFTLIPTLFLTAFQQQTTGISPWVWFLIIIVVVIIVWYFLRSRSTETPTPITKPEAAVFTPAPVAEDDLIIIEGIGPKIAAVLKSAGITTFNQLAATDSVRLQQILEQGGIRLADPRSWPEQARLAASGDRVGLAEYQERLKGGRAV